MPRYVEVAVNVPSVTEVFHYHLPPELDPTRGGPDMVQPGSLVVVPFGSQTVEGVVTRFISQPSVADTKAVLDVVDEAVVLTPLQLALATYLAESTLSSLAQAIALMAPPGLMQRADTEYSLASTEPTETTGAFTLMEMHLMELLHERGPMRTGQLERSIRQDWRTSMRRLQRLGRVKARHFLPPPSVQAKFIRTVELAVAPEILDMTELNLGRPGTPAAERRLAILNFLRAETGPVDVAWAYAASGGKLDDLRFLAEQGLVTLGESEFWRDPLAELEFVPTTPPPLTQDQAKVWGSVREAIRSAKAGKSVPPLLLHGVTGSGKTEIYLHAVAETLALGRSAIILVPEIALTPQTVRRFVSRFPGQVGVLHSALSAGERYDTWRRVRMGRLPVIVGPRSALFTPQPNLGLVVVDESHDESYYQDSPAPHYHARQAAIEAARLAGGVCILGSATPDVTSTHQTSLGEHAGGWRRLHLPARILAHQEAVQAQLERLARQKQSQAGEPQAGAFHHFEALAETRDLPAVQVVDMRQELVAGNRSIFSRELQDALSQVLERGEQAILFLNRRGAGSYVFCRDCGHSLACPRCNLPLTYHSASSLAVEGPGAGQVRLVCHHCGYQRGMPETCPECGSKRVRHFGLGTERVEQDLLELFPQARPIRWDADTTRRKGAHEIILGHFAAQRADVLIGTQMIAKGLDLPLVTLVGVVLADVGLNLPDYRAGERTFQVLTQVAGRAGRSLLGGRVVLQTFQPEHYVIQAAAGHDYDRFYTQELGYRRQLGYPPFTQLVRLELRGYDLAQIERSAQEMAGRLRQWIAADERRATALIGPAPCFFERLGGLYRWHIILRGPDPVSLLRNRPIGEWKVEVNPPNLL